MDLVDQMEQAVAGRDDGIRRAVEHADRIEPDWAERAFAWIERWALTHPGESATTKRLRYMAVEDGLPRPPTNFAWGGPILRAARAGVLVRAGATMDGDATMHVKLVPVWRSAWPT